MKKQFFAAVTSIAVVAAMSVSAFAVAPGSTNGTATAEVTVSKTEATTVPAVGVEDAQIEVSAGAFDLPDGTKVEIVMEKEDLKDDKAAQEVVIKQIEEKLAAISDVVVDSAPGADTKVVVSAVNTKIDISAYADNQVIEPNGDITITVAYDGASNKVAHFLDNGSIELLDLKTSGTVCSFTTKSFSEFYMITVDETPAAQPEQTTTAATEPTTNAPVKDNPSTGVVLVAIPAVAAAAAVVLSKKRK